MLFKSKKKKIEQYLASKAHNYTAFDKLLADYQIGSLGKEIIQLGVEKAEFYIDFLDDYKCINIQGKYRGYFIDIQIEENEFSIAYDQDEPDEPQGYALVTKEDFYTILVDTLKKLA